MSHLPRPIPRRSTGATPWPAAAAFMRLRRILLAASAASVALATAAAEGQAVIRLGEGAIDVSEPGAPQEAVAVGLEADQALTPEAMARQQLEQMAAQYEPLFQRILESDLELLRSLHGDLPVESRRAIVTAGEEAVKIAALRLGESLQAPRRVVPPPRQGRGVFAAIGRALGLEVLPEEPLKRPEEPVQDEEPPADPARVVDEALQKSLVEQIGEERAATFIDELAEREQREREASIRRLVGLLDDDLYLSGKQRSAIEEALAADWHEGIAMAADQQTEFNGEKIYLGLPYERVLPHLTTAQQAKMGDGKQAREMFGDNWRSTPQSRFFRRANRAQQTERDPWWFE